MAATNLIQEILIHGPVVGQYRRGGGFRFLGFALLVFGFPKASKLLEPSS